MAEEIFVTGGSGYLGRNLIRRLVRDGHAVVALARSAASAARVEALGATAVEGDMLDPASLEAGMAGCTRLVHAAADTGHGAFEADQHQTNLAGTTNVFTAARRAGIARGVHVSTEAVLLSGAPLIDADETTPIPARHAGSYSASKAAAERAALALDSAQCPIVVVRPRFVWGRDDTTALPQLAAAARSGKLAWIDGGHYRTSTAHIDNVCEGIALALEKGRGGEAYFITDGAPVEFRAFVTRLLQAAGLEVPAREVPRWLLVSLAHVGDFLARISRGRVHGPIGLQELGTVGTEVTLNIAKAERELGYHPVISIDQGMATVEQM